LIDDLRLTIDEWRLVANRGRSVSIVNRQSSIVNPVASIVNRQSSIVNSVLVFLLLPGIAFSRSDDQRRSERAFVCGTSAEREVDALARGLYHESRNRGRVLAAHASRRIQADQGDVAVVEDNGTVVSQTNLFDLEARSFRFEPTGASTYRVVSTSTSFDSPSGNPIELGDDDSRPVNLGFNFVFYGASYSSVYVNSDGNLTFTSPDTTSSPRDLGRFSGGPPRIGPFFSDLDPTNRGVNVRNEADGILFIWSNVPNWQTNNSNSFSVKLFLNGNIEFVYAARMDGRSTVVGISPGFNQGGLNAVNFSSDLPTGSLAGTVVEVFSSDSALSETALARLFFQTHPDTFDQLIVFLAFDFSLGGAYAYEINVRNEIGGIGLGQIDNSSFYGSNGRLRSFVMMGGLDGPSRFPADPNQVYLGTNSTLGILGQEAGHRWLAFAGFREGEANSRAILGRQSAHWSFFFDSDASVMEGTDIEDRGDDRGNSRFATVAATSTYSQLDRYMMGLAGKDEVPEMFVVVNPTGTSRSPTSAPEVGVAFGGTRKEISIDSIIAANGHRTPSVLQSPKVFRQAFILLTRKGTPATSEQIAKVQTIRDAWVSFFNRQTGGRGWVDTSLQTSPGTTPAELYFPHFQGDRRHFTGVALANWGSIAADVQLTAFDNSGNQTGGSAVNPRVVTLGPGQHVDMLGEQIHGLSLDDARNGWIQARSSSSQVTGLFLEGDVDSSLLDGAVVEGRTHTEFYFTRIQRLEDFFYRNTLEVINPGASTATLEFTLFDEFGMVSAVARRTLNPRGRLAEELTSLFSSAPGRGGYIRVTSDAGVVGYQSIRGGSAVFALPGQAAAAGTRLYSAQFASGGTGAFQYFTDLNLINTSTQTRSVEITLVGNNGAPVAGTRNPLTLTLAPGRQIRSRGDLLFGLADAVSSRTLTEGSIVVKSDGPGVIGDSLFGDPLGEAFLAALPLETEGASDLVFSQVVQGSSDGGGRPYFTGVALYNPNSHDLRVTLDVIDQNGTKMGSAPVDLGAGERVSRTLPQLITGIGGQIRGYMRISATGPIVASELVGDQMLQFLTAVRPQRISP
jgi:hypothetical protein